MKRCPRVLTVEEAARRVVYDGRPPKGAPFVCPDGRQICGAKAKGVVGPNGEKYRCENEPSANGRCNTRHSGSKTGPGAPPSKEAMVVRWLGVVAQGKLDSDLLSGSEDLDLYERRIRATLMQLSESADAADIAHWRQARALYNKVRSGGDEAVSAMKALGELLGRGAGVELLENKLDALTLRRNTIRKDENKRIIDGEEMITRRQHVAALTVLLGTALEVAYAFISLDRQAEYRRALHKQVASYIS